MSHTLRFGDKDIVVGQEIAKGGSARIYSASCAGEQYVLKHLSVTDPKIYDDAITEIYFHLQFNNEKCVVRLHGLLLDDTYIPANFARFDEYLTLNDMHSSQSHLASSIKSSQFANQEPGLNLSSSALPVPGVSHGGHDSNRRNTTKLPCTNIRLLLEYCSGGNCVKLLIKCSEHRVFLPEPLIWRFAYNITLAILCLHSKGCSHRDLKLENILILEPYTLDDILENNGCTTKFPEFLRLCDFGSCTMESYDSERLRDMMENEQGMKELMRSLELKTTPCFRAPEQIKIDPEFPLGTAVDVFAFGILLYRLMYRRLPFPDNDLRYNYRAEFSFQDKRVKYSDALKNIISLCLVQHPKDRVSIFEIHKLVRNEVRNLGFIETNIFSTTGQSNSLARSTRVSILHAAPEAAHPPATENTVNIVLAYKPMIPKTVHGDLTVVLDKEDSGGLDLSQASMGNLSLLEDTIASVTSASQTVTGIDTGQSLSHSKYAFTRSLAGSVGVNINLGLSASGVPACGDRGHTGARDRLTVSAISGLADPRAAYPGRFMQSPQCDVGLSESILMALGTPEAPHLVEELRNSISDGLTNACITDQQALKLEQVETLPTTSPVKVSPPAIPEDSLAFKAYSLLPETIKERVQTITLYESLHSRLQVNIGTLRLEPLLPLLLETANLFKI
ncbi:Kinase/ NAK/ Serine/threonine protein kinase [Giardia duodenalis assemblage B]|uniref:Kinase/ NAK/ Serine/threonine protein kinase n=1 Tax=Giardia duodenalis assemblage B TaxID=1394984 RepID=A0A132NWW7_GIAIN|nr:Kinase/ NAK/ Serine/threonine protein kinase [Giardia intestinalis assemblage B]